MKCDASNVVVVILHVTGTSFTERTNFNCACVLVKCWPPKSLDLHILSSDYEFIEKTSYNRPEQTHKTDIPLNNLQSEHDRLF